ncbi:MULTISPECIES: MATE family efflux transporter [unclassified Shouchella]|uniref:MATE family efflux transporter n=1 Tax=unclassified Shouchella TaxID=2893065 RepID=UPI0039A07B9F
MVSFSIVMFSFVATGEAILISQHLGANRYKSARTIAVTAISLNLISGTIISMFIYFFGSCLLQFMDSPLELMDETSLYLRIVGGFLFFKH